MKKRTWLKQLRLSKGLTQDNVANKVFIDRGFYAQIENGTRDPSMNVASKIASLFGINPGIFFMGYLDALKDGMKDFDSYSIFSQSDVELKYTWIFHPRKSVEELIGKRDDEFSKNDGVLELIHLKKQVILQGVPLEKIIMFPGEPCLRPYLAQCEPLWDDDGRVAGVNSVLTFMPGLYSNYLGGTREARIIHRGHVLYFYNNALSYVENAIKYIVDGIEYGYHVLVMENEHAKTILNDRIKGILTTELHSHVHFVNNMEVYQTNHSFDVEGTTEQLIKTWLQYYKKGIPMRIWSHVVWRMEQNAMLQKICNFESALNEEIIKTTITAVCALALHPDGKLWTCK